MSVDKPLYETIKEDIVSRIRSGELAPGSRIPTEAEICSMYKVSRITVSKALGVLKADGYLVRYPKKGSFVSGNVSSVAVPASGQNRTSSELVLPDAAPVHNTVVLLMPDITDSYALEIIRGLQNSFKNSGYQLEMIPTYNSHNEDRILNQLLHSNVSGILLFPVDQPFYSDTILYMKLTGFPVVVIDRIFDKINLDYVISDNRAGARALAAHFLSLGHEKLAFVTSETTKLDSVRERYKGVRDALREAGLSLDSLISIEEFDHSHSEESRAFTLKRIIAREHVTGLIFAESFNCLDSYVQLKRMNFRIPEDVSIACFDNPVIDVADFDIFTHVDQHPYDQAQKAAGILLDKLKSSAADPVQIRTTPSLLIRQSTGPAPSKS